MLTYADATRGLEYAKRSVYIGGHTGFELGPGGSAVCDVVVDAVAKERRLLKQTSADVSIRQHTSAYAML